MRARQQVRAEKQRVVPTTPGAIAYESIVPPSAAALGRGLHAQGQLSRSQRALQLR